MKIAYKIEGNHKQLDKNIKIKYWGTFWISKKNFLILEGVFFVLFATLSLIYLIGNFEAPPQSSLFEKWMTENAAIFFISSLVLVIIEAQFFLNRFISVQLDIIAKQKNEIEQNKQEILEKNQILENQKEEIAQQAESLQEAFDKISVHLHEITKQKEIIEHKNKDITDSITYARRIQQAVLPNQQLFTEAFREHFVFFKPKDIVSGDFYWIKNVDNQGESFTFLAVADCTGHGVPGAFMSLLGLSFFNEIVPKHESNVGMLTASMLLEELRVYIKTSLHQFGNDTETKDGMDIALCVINRNNWMLQYAGANNPVLIVNNATNDPALIELKPTRNPVGVHLKELPFQTTAHQLQPNDTLYLFSDGIVDQFGGDDNSKYKIRRLKNFLLTIQAQSMQIQAQLIEKELTLWQGNIHQQIDDILVVGIKV